MKYFIKIFPNADNTCKTSSTHTTNWNNVHNYIANSPLRFFNIIWVKVLRRAINISIKAGVKAFHGVVIL